MPGPRKINPELRFINRYESVVRNGGVPDLPSSCLRAGAPPPGPQDYPQAADPLALAACFIEALTRGSEP